MYKRQTFRLGIIIAGVILILTKVSSWRTSLTYIASVFVFAGIGNLLMPDMITGPIYQVLTGGLLYGAFFMATDPVSSPFTHSGKIVYGLALGFLTVLIRAFSGSAEGVMFSIIIMNAFGPLIDSYVLEHKYKPLSQ